METHYPGFIVFFYADMQASGIEKIVILGADVSSLLGRCLLLGFCFLSAS